MYLKELRKMTDSDLMSIRDQLRILKDVVYNLQSLDANLKKKKRGFAAGTRKELRMMYTFHKNSTDKVEQVLKERARKSRELDPQLRKVERLWDWFQKHPNHDASDAYYAAYSKLSDTQKRVFKSRRKNKK